MEKIYMVYVTASGKEEAAKIGKELLNQGLAACVNIYDNMTAMYWWEDKIEVGAEATLIIKTKATLLEDLKRKVRDLHSYTCPCILALEVADADADYAEWVINQTK